MPDTIARLRRLKGNNCFYYSVERFNDGVWSRGKEFNVYEQAKEYFDFITAPDEEVIESNFIKVKLKEHKERKGL